MGGRPVHLMALAILAFFQAASIVLAAAEPSAQDKAPVAANWVHSWPANATERHLLAMAGTLR